MKLVLHEEMLLALLRAALHQQEVETACFQLATAEDWVRCFRLAVRQGVAALAWESIESLPTECCPPLDVKLSWALVEKKQVAKYRKHCKALNELSKLYNQHGITTMVLKGVGLSRLYPVPAHRVGGDIDIYTYSADKTKMTDEEANRLANELMKQQGILIDYSNLKLHSSFCYQGVLFENHRSFFNTDIYAELFETDKWLKESMSSQSVNLLDGNCRISVPSVVFDSVFVSLHAAKHYGNGLSLRHLCDWVVLLLHGGLNLPEELNNKYLQQIIAVLSILTNRYLGTSMPVEGYDKLANEMMEEIMRPPSYAMNPYSDPIRACWCKIRLKLHLLGLREHLLGVPIWKSIMNYILSILYKPSRLYK